MSAQGCFTFSNLFSTAADRKGGEKCNLKGLLEEVDEDSIKLELKGITQQIPFSSIIQANLII